MDRAQILISAIDEASTVLDKIERKMGSVGSAADALKYALGALGGVISINAFSNMIEGAIGAENALYELNLKTGLSVELLSALRPIAAEAGSNMDLVGTSVQKLEKNMLSFVQTGTGPAALGFEAIGISRAQAQAGLANMNAFLPEFAKKLLDAGNGAQVAALAQEVFGKAGANLIPVLKALAERVELVGTKTTEQVARAHEFTAEMAQMSERTQLLKESMADGLLPALTHIAEAFVDLRGKGTDAEGFFNTLGVALKYGATAAGLLWLALKDMGDGIGALGAQTAALLSGNLAAFKAIGAERDAQAAKNLAEFEAFQRSLLGADKAAPVGKETPANPDVAGKGKTAGLSEHDLQVYANAVQAVKELDAAEKARSKDLDEQDKQFVAAMKEFDAWTDAQNKALDQQAQNWKDLIDPSAKYFEQLQQIDDLLEKGRLTEDEAARARTLTMDKLTQAVNGATAAAKQADSFGQQMGLTFSSAFESAISKGKSLRDVLKGIGQDIAAIITRQTITNPMGSAISGLISGATGGGSFGDLLTQFMSPNMGITGTASFDPVAASVLGTYATGTDYVPQTGLYQLHQGEKVVSASANSGGGNGQPVVVQFTINAVDARSVNELIAQPSTQRVIRGIIEQGYAANGTVSGMASR